MTVCARGVEGLWEKECLPASENLTGAQEGGILGAISFFVAWVVLSFISSIVLDIVDAVYLCYAIDKDNQTVTMSVVHEIYSKVRGSPPISPFLCAPTRGKRYLYFHVLSSIAVKIFALAFERVLMPVTLK